jgi:hypothetical protein
MPRRWSASPTPPGGHLADGASHWLVVDDHCPGGDHPAVPPSTRFYQVVCENKIAPLPVLPLSWLDPKVGHQILESLGLRPRRLEIVSCPSCGRAQVDVHPHRTNHHRLPKLPPPPAHRRHGLRRQRTRRSPRSRPRRLRRQRQRPNLHPRQNHQTVPEDHIVQTLLHEGHTRNWTHPPP